MKDTIDYLEIDADAIDVAARLVREVVDCQVSGSDMLFENERDMERACRILQKEDIAYDVARVTDIGQGVPEGKVLSVFASTRNGDHLHRLFGSYSKAYGFLRNLRKDLRGRDVTDAESLELVAAVRSGGGFLFLDDPCDSWASVWEVEIPKTCKPKP